LLLSFNENTEGETGGRRVSGLYVDFNHGDVSQLAKCIGSSTILGSLVVIGVCAFVCGTL